MYNLFLDDVRDANKFLQDIRVWETARDYNQFVRLILKKGLPQFISFDHDLAWEHYGNPNVSQYTEKTGYDCAKWLVEFCMKTEQPLPDFQVHSMNPVGKINIQSLLTNYRDKTQLLNE